MPEATGIQRAYQICSKDRIRLKAQNAEMLEVLEKIDTHFRNAPPKEVKEHVDVVLNIIWAVGAIVAKVKGEGQ